MKNLVIIILITSFNSLNKITMSEIKKDNLKNSLCYIPFAAIVLSFTEEEKSEELKKHIKH